MLDSVRLFTPEIFLSAVALFLLGVDAFVGPRRVKAWTLAVSFASLAAAFFMLCSGDSGRAFGMLVSDGFSSFFKVLALLAATLVLLLSEKDDALFGSQAGTYAALVLFSTVGVMLLSSAEDLLIFFVAMELTAVPLFILTGFLRKDLRSSEGAVKFFLVGAFSTGLMVYGMSFLYGICGSTGFSAIRGWFLSHPQAGSDPMFILGVLFMLAGLGFKLSLVPFHQWTPDAYQGAPTPVTAFFSVSREAGVIVVMLRFFGGFVDSRMAGLTELFAAMAVLTMTIGNLTALKQTNLKRLLAYSSIAHAGTIFVGIVAGNQLGREGVMLYSFAYFLMSLGAFSVVILVSRLKNSEDISSVRGLARENFGLALLMAFFLFSLTGIPPFLGFWGKFYVFAAAVEAKMYWLVAAGLVNSLIAAYYYFRILHAMFFQEPETTSNPFSSCNLCELSVKAATVFSASVLLIVGIVPQTFMAWVKATAHLLP